MELRKSLVKQKSMEKVVMINIQVSPITFQLLFWRVVRSEVFRIEMIYLDHWIAGKILLLVTGQEKTSVISVIEDKRLMTLSQDYTRKCSDEKNDLVFLVMLKY